MFTKIPLKGGNEYDALTGWRKWYKYLDKSGQKKAAKKSYNRRFRRLTRQSIRNNVYHEDFESRLR